MTKEHSQEDHTQESNSGDALVCYCHRLTTGMLKAAYSKLGSLKAVEEATGAGNACTGCKVILHSLFGEAASDHYNLEQAPVVGSTCKKPGNRIMKGFIVANDELESTVYSSNGVAPQFSDCDADTDVEYLLLDHRGQPVLHRKTVLRTNETFVFDTRKENFPRPLYGQFLLVFGRANYGASRFNIQWSNKRSFSSTHENSTTGRPRVILPLPVDRGFLAGNSSIYLGIMNPHQATVPFSLSVRDLDSPGDMRWHTELPPFCSTWLPANEHLFTPAVEARPEGRYVLEVSAHANMHNALSVYFFFYNKETDLWTVNHL